MGHYRKPGNFSLYDLLAALHLDTIEFNRKGAKGTPRRKWMKPVRTNGGRNAKAEEEANSEF